MARDTRAERRRERAQQELATNGWLAIVIGILLLTVIPAFMPGSLARILGPALRPLGWMGLAIGIALLGVHFVVRRKAASTPIERIEPGTTAAPARRTPTAKTAPRREPALWSESTPLSSPATSASAPAQAQQWSAAVFDAIEWRRFEALCEAFYAQAGFSTRSQSHGPDGGVDIWLQSRHLDTPRIVQCKHWRNTQVGLRDLREFLGAMTSHKLQNGTFVTSSTFTREAAAFADANGIQAQDGAALLKLIRLRTAEQQAELLAVAYEGEYWRPTCASCGIKMVERPAKAGRAGFWGCSNFRRCGAKPIWKAKSLAKS